MAGSTPGDYDQFVVVAEDQWKIKRFEEFSFVLAGLECECTFLQNANITLKCNEFAKGWTEDVHLELFFCDTQYRAMAGFPTRITLTKNSSSWQKYQTQRYDRMLMTIRVLRERSSLPDFTSKDVRIGHLRSNCELLVGVKMFHVHKEVLSMYSPYFDRMFHGEFKEAKQDFLKLETEKAPPALFHDFLLFMTPAEFNRKVLPNSKNVVGLHQLAKFYQVDLLKEKCEKLIENSYDMPVWERIMAAKKVGNEELESRIVNKLNTMEDWRVLALKALKFVKDDQ